MQLVQASAHSREFLVADSLHSRVEDGWRRVRHAVRLEDRSHRSIVRLRGFGNLRRGSSPSRLLLARKRRPERLDVRLAHRAFDQSRVDPNTGLLAAARCLLLVVDPLCHTGHGASFHRHEFDPAAVDLTFPRRLTSWFRPGMRQTFSKGAKPCATENRTSELPLLPLDRQLLGSERGKTNKHFLRTASRLRRIEATRGSLTFHRPDPDRTSLRPPIRTSATAESPTCPSQPRGSNRLEAGCRSRKVVPHPPASEPCIVASSRPSRPGQRARPRTPAPGVFGSWVSDSVLLSKNVSVLNLDAHPRAQGGAGTFAGACERRDFHKRRTNMRALPREGGTRLGIDESPGRPATTATVESAIKRGTRFSSGRNPWLRGADSRYHPLSLLHLVLDSTCRYRDPRAAAADGSRVAVCPEVRPKTAPRRVRDIALWGRSSGRGREGEGECACSARR